MLEKKDICLAFDGSLLAHDASLFTVMAVTFLLQNTVHFGGDCSRTMIILLFITLRKIVCLSQLNLLFIQELCT